LITVGNAFQTATGKTTAAAKSNYQLKVTLREVEPPVWRRIQIPASTYLDNLHLMIQAAIIPRSKIPTVLADFDHLLTF